jgi:hypothetical protein
MLENSRNQSLQFFYFSNKQKKNTNILELFFFAKSTYKFIAIYNALSTKILFDYESSIKHLVHKS